MHKSSRQLCVFTVFTLLWNVLSIRILNKCVDSEAQAQLYFKGGFLTEVAPPTVGYLNSYNQNVPSVREKKVIVVGETVPAFPHLPKILTKIKIKKRRLDRKCVHPQCFAQYCHFWYTLRFDSRHLLCYNHRALPWKRAVDTGDHLN